MAALTYLQATVSAPPGMTARTHRGAKFEPTEVQWCAYPWGLAVTVIDTRRSTYNTTLYPEHHDLSGLPHPGEWFDHLAAQVREGGAS